MDPADRKISQIIPAERMLARLGADAGEEQQPAGVNGLSRLNG